MEWRKNVSSYLLWFFYTIMVGTFMVGIGNIFCGDNFPSYCGAVFAVVLIAALGGAAFLLHCLAPRLRAYIQNKGKLCLAAETGILAVLLVMGVMFRTAGLQSVEKTSVYYEMAEVAMGQDVSQIVHGAVHVYVQMLHLVLLFLGNHFVVGIIVQVIFQGIAALLFYFQVRKYVGRLAALVVAGFFTCAPYMIRGGLTLSPDAMYLCLFAAAGSAVAAACIHGIGNVTAGRKLSPLFFIFAGVVSSVMAYLDVAGVLLLLFAVGMVFADQNSGGQNFGNSNPGNSNPGNSNPGNSNSGSQNPGSQNLGSQNPGLGKQLSGLGRKALASLFCVLGFIFGFAGCAMMDLLVSGKSFVSVLQVWFQLYGPKKFQLPAVAGMPDSRVESLVLIGLMALGIYSFWFEKKKERFMVCMLASCMVVLAGCFGMFTAEMPGTLFLYLLFVIMAGIGLQQCFGGGDALKIQAARTEGDEQKMQEQEVQKQNLQERKMQEQEVQEQSENKPDALADKESVEKKEKKDIKYLENPLPLPKKHEKKVLDYDYPVADDDDFDI